MLNIDETVLSELQAARPGEKMDGAMLLRDVGLSSLDLASVVARLELKLSLDPFSELVSITSVRTIGDLVSAYRLAAEGAENAPSTLNAQLGVDRGAARRREGV